MIKDRTFCIKCIDNTLNIVAPFTVGYLLHSAMNYSNWRFWTIIAILVLYRGFRK